MNCDPARAFSWKRPLDAAGQGTTNSALLSTSLMVWFAGNVSRSPPKTPALLWLILAPQDTWEPLDGAARKPGNPERSGKVSEVDPFWNFSEAVICISFCIVLLGDQ